ncbi:nitrogen permease regulator 2, partial [Gorgonomyces haynaldii]
MTQFPLVRGIFFCDFHHIQGPRVTFETPEGLTSSSLAQDSLDFDSISDYLIPKSELCNRLVSITTQHYKILGYPVKIVNPKYPRNALLFNFCFCFDTDADTRSYDQVVKKIAVTLQALEMEREFISKDQKSQLLNILEQVMEDLNSYHESQIIVDDANTIDIKLFPLHPDPPQVHDYQVPVLTLDFKFAVDKHWDLTMRRTLPYINGVNTVKHIAAVSGVHISFVRLAVQHLLYYGCAQMVDVFQFSNIYNVTPKISEFLHSQDMQLDCQQFVTGIHADPVSTGILCSLYCSLKGGIKVSEWIHENPLWTAQIDVRKFILYGLVKGIISRVHRYPYLYQETSVPLDLLKYLDGKHHLDEICTIKSWTHKQTQKMLSHLPVRYIL